MKYQTTLFLLFVIFSLWGQESSKHPIGQEPSSTKVFKEVHYGFSLGLYDHSFFYGDDHKGLYSSSLTPRKAFFLEANMRYHPFRVHHFFALQMVYREDEIYVRSGGLGGSKIIGGEVKQLRMGLVFFPLDVDLVHFVNFKLGAGPNLVVYSKSNAQIDIRSGANTSLEPVDKVLTTFGVSVNSRLSFSVKLNEEKSLIAFYGFRMGTINEFMDKGPTKRMNHLVGLGIRF